ncbi:hypothetical protein [uncultured Ilyobacter sp.]|uniref:hypothetical protein n=1 Tax=uncultured Ilyobacter sp. TaxID=544433 RepID=UPI0029C0AAF4|nr:hypothetical protein [uncultured Ilyobacter sp.]
MECFKNYIQDEIENLISTGKISSVEELNKVIGEEKFDITNPQYFTGNPESDLVLVHLIPKRNINDFNKPFEFDNFEEYYNYYKKFGKNKYGSLSNGTHKSPFDKKQVRFLKELNILPFTGDEMEDLEISIDEKLQLQLIPYGTTNFNYKEIPEDTIDLYIEKVLKGVLAYERKYILFCGVVFRDSGYLNNYIVNKSIFRERLLKKDGTPTKNKYEFINIKIKYKDQLINAAILPHYGIQGAPIDEYGKFVYSNYGKY